MGQSSKYLQESHEISSCATGVLRAGVNLLVILAVIVMLFSAQPAEAATLLVDRLDDDPTATDCNPFTPNDCSLRGAIIAANNFGTHPGLDTISLPAGTYVLDEVGTGEADALDGDLDIRGDLIINGADEATTIIDGNGSVTLEQVFTVDGSVSLEMNDLTITGGGGTGSSVGGIVAFGGLTLSHVTIDSNHGSGSAGGIYSSTDLTITDSTISNNTGQTGGIFVYNGTLTMTSSTVDGNIATASGGGLNFNNGTGTIQGNSHIENNQATGGGGVAAYSGTLTIENSTLSMNTATSSGGGLYVSIDATVILNNTTVSSNLGTSYAGGAVVFGSLEMHGGEISTNYASTSGGGIEVEPNSTVEIYDAYVNGNYVTADPSYGGGIYNQSGQVTLERTTVSLNYVSGTVTSPSYGGGIYSFGGDLTLTDTRVNENMAIDAGGGVYFSSGTLVVTNSIFRGNTLTGTYASGAGLFNGSSATATIQQTEFSSNNSSNISGGIHTQGTLTLENVTISDNSALHGAGIISTGDPGKTTDILNSTIYGNTVPSGSLSAGLVVYNTVTVKNTIVAGNDNDECLNDSGTAITSLGNNLSGDSTCGFGLGSDQQNTDPLLGPLADNGGFSKTHALLPGSPALDAGTNSGCPLTDQRGVNRPIDSDLNGTATCDIGAYEATIDLFLPLIAR